MYKRPILTVALCLLMSLAVSSVHGVPYFEASANYHVDSYPIAIASGDFNGDTHADLVTANNAASSITVLLNDGDGTFGNRSDYSTGASHNPYNVTTGDLDGDGAVDILAAGSMGLSIFYGVGDGTFDSVDVYYWGHSASDVVVADFNKDSYLDIASGHPVGDTVWIHLNNHDSTFTRHKVVTENGPKSLAIGQLDSDTYVDILVGCKQGTVWNLENDQSGNFTPTQVHIGYLDDQAIVAVADLDGDDVGDFAVYQASHDFLVTFINDGDGTYSTDKAYVLADFLSDIAIGDVNYDNKPDILLSNMTDEVIELYLNDGANAFSLDTSYSTGAVPRGLVFEDFDGDGYDDLAAASYTNDDAAVFINRMSLILSVDDVTPNGVLPDVFTLEQNYPNPFNPETKIRFALPTASDVRVEVFNMLGQSVMILVDEHLTAGIKEIAWHGTDESGRAVSSGMYFYRITADGFSASKKMLLLK